MNASMDNLCKGLEGAFEVPVINETGIDGRYDIELEFPAKDMNAAKAALLATLGLRLIEVERPIQMLEVSAREDSGVTGVPNPAPRP